MIRKVLAYYTERLEEFLKGRFHQPEGIVEISVISGSAEVKKNKMLISLFCIERDTSGGIVATHKGSSKGLPALHVNLNIIFAAVYDDRRYVESLSVLSSTLLFLQATPSFIYNGTTYTIDIVSYPSQELNNIWSNIGGQYYPSVLCKLKGVTFDAGEIKHTSKDVSRPLIDM